MIFAPLQKLQFLIQNNADVNIQNNEGATLLIDAAISCRPDLAEILLKNGADTTLRDNYGKTALAHALGSVTIISGEPAADQCTPVVTLLQVYGAKQ